MNAWEAENLSQTMAEWLLVDGLSYSMTNGVTEWSNWRSFYECSLCLSSPVNQFWELSSYPSHRHRQNTLSQSRSDRGPLSFPFNIGGGPGAGRDGRERKDTEKCIQDGSKLQVRMPSNKFIKYINGKRFEDGSNLQMRGSGDSFWKHTANVFEMPQTFQIGRSEKE